MKGSLFEAVSQVVKPNHVDIGPFRDKLWRNTLSVITE